MAFPTTSVLDNFNRTNASSLGANWETFVSGDPNIPLNGNRALANTSWCGNAWVTDCSTLDQEVWGTLSDEITNDASAWFGLYLRCKDVGTTTPDGFGVEYFPQTSSLRLVRLTNNSATAITSVTRDVAVGEKLGCEVISGNLKVYHYTGGSWVHVSALDATTTTLAGGNSTDHQGFQLAMELTRSGMGADDFGGGDVSAGTSTSDTRDVRVTGQASSSTDRDVRVTGDATTTPSDTSRDARVIGQSGPGVATLPLLLLREFDDPAYIVDVRVTGSAAGGSSDRAQDARVTGRADSSVSYDVRLRGQADSAASYDVRLRGQADSNVSYDARLRGQADSGFAQDVRVRGQADSSASYDVRLNGQSDASHAVDVRAAGQTAVADERAVRLAGQTATSTTLDARVFGTLASSVAYTVMVVGIAPDYSRHIGSASLRRFGTSGHLNVPPASTRIRR